MSVRSDVFDILSEHDAKAQDPEIHIADLRAATQLCSLTEFRASDLERLDPKLRSLFERFDAAFAAYHADSGLTAHTLKALELDAEQNAAAEALVAQLKRVLPGYRQSGEKGRL